jgi:hypothetical protein
LDFDMADEPQCAVNQTLFRRMSHSCRVDGGSSRTSISIHGLGYPLTALRRQGLIPDELVLQLATFLRSHDLFLELRVRTLQTLTANQVRQGGKQGTDGRERSRIHFSACPASTSLLRSLRPKD